MSSSLRSCPGWWLVSSLALCLLSSCATFDEDVHLSPLFSHLSTPGGGREFEALAGAVRVRRPHPAADVNEWALRPFVSQQLYPSGDSLTRFLVPLGQRQVKDGEDVTRLLPIFRFHHFQDEEGRPGWRALIFPIVLWSQEPSGRVVRALFPIGGVIERFLTFERIHFVLFPVFVSTERAQRETTHFPWPFLMYSTQPGVKPSWRVWPLYGIYRTAGHQRRFWLWPFFHYHRNNLRFSPELEETKWMVFPLYGESKRGSFRAWTWLWPFFGWSRDRQSGFWAFDGPWPIFRLQRPGTSEDVAWRTRVWPFFSYFRNQGLESTWFLWPFFNRRVETYPDGVRRAEFVVPFYQHWRRSDREGEPRAGWTKVWPLYQDFNHPPYRRQALPALNPLWHTPMIDDHYAWLYELYTREEMEGRTRERSWGGIWRREVDGAEERDYIAGLWSRRKYRAGGETVRETSLLFGLLRWRSRKSARFQPMLPALPGPGWPAERLPEP